MFGSQALEVAIGLVLMLFVFASAASAIVEFGAKVTKKRSKDLEAAIARLLRDGELPAGADDVLPPEITKLLKAGAGRTNANYLSAKAFVDAATQLLAEAGRPDAGDFDPFADLRKKAGALAREAKGDLTAVKAGLETWFDEAMSSLQDTYKKWASILLLAAGLGLAVLLNASTINVAQSLWADSVTRDAVVKAADTTVEGGAEGACKGEGELSQVACQVDSISQLKLPLGWSAESRPSGSSSQIAAWWFTHVVGWAVTGFLVMLGAPFWFDLLTRLVNLRGGGQRPKPAADDDGSNTVLMLSAPGGSASDTHRDLLERLPAGRAPASLDDDDWLAFALHKT